MAPDTFSLFLSELVFPEGPRWHENKLWFSDMHDHRVLMVDRNWHTSVALELSDCPSGLGWLADGTLLVVSMKERRLLRVRERRVLGSIDLSQKTSGPCNDMVVASNGTAYISTFGFDLWAGAERKLAEIIIVRQSGEVQVAATELDFPNGMVITPDQQNLIVGETNAGRLTMFEIARDGNLHNPKLWAAPANCFPDGICLDAEGAIWIASPRSREVLRVKRGGEISHRISFHDRAYACILGGEDLRTLFVLCASTHQPLEAQKLRSGKIYTRIVEVPGVGLPINHKPEVENPRHL